MPAGTGDLNFPGLLHTGFELVAESFEGDGEFFVCVRNVDHQAALESAVVLYKEKIHGEVAPVFFEDRDFQQPGTVAEADPFA